MSAKRKKKQYSVLTIVLALVVCAAFAVARVVTPVEKEQARTPVAEERAEAQAQAAAVVSVSEGSQGETKTKAEVIPSLEVPRLVEKRSQQIIEHVGYTVSYNHDWRIPNWVAWELTDEETCGELERADHFVPDPLVKGDPVVTKDYSKSGYDRGHMAPAADMKWSEQAMRESFYMTNMCPQHHSNNAGDWKDLEELGRDLAQTYQQIYICCGPIVTDPSVTIGTVRKIVVPQSFYKVFLRQKKDGSWTAIGFVMDNAPGNRPLMTYMRTVDEVEELTGIDFFYQLPDSIEDIVEADFTVSDWTVTGLHPDTNRR